MRDVKATTRELSLTLKIVDRRPCPTETSSWMVGNQEVNVASCLLLSGEKQSNQTVPWLEFQCVSCRLRHPTLKTVVERSPWQIACRCAGCGFWRHAVWSKPCSAAEKTPSNVTKKHSTRTSENLP